MQQRFLENQQRPFRQQQGNSPSQRPFGFGVGFFDGQQQSRPFAGQRRQQGQGPPGLLVNRFVPPQSNNINQYELKDSYQGPGYGYGYGQQQQRRFESPQYNENNQYEFEGSYQVPGYGYGYIQQQSYRGSPRREQVLFDFGSYNDFGRGNFYDDNRQQSTTTEAPYYT